MRLLDYLGLLRQRLGLVITVIGVVSALALSLSLVQDPQYEAGVRIQVRPPAPGSAIQEELERFGLQSDLGTEAELVKSKQVLDAVAQDFGLPEAPPALVDQITVLPLGDSAVLLMRVVANAPEDAIQLANAIAETYLESRREEARQAVDGLRASIELEAAEAESRSSRADTVMRATEEGTVPWADAKAERDAALFDLGLARQRMRAVDDASAISEGFGEIIEPASRARTLREASPARSMVFGILLGVPLALAAVLLLDSLSDTVRTKTDAESLTGAEVIGLIPADDQARNRDGLPAVDVDPFSAVSESYRTSSLNLTRLAEQAGASSVLITSPLDGEGKTTTAVNLAIAQSERGIRTLLVEADLRRPRTHMMLGVPRAPGMADVLSGTTTPRKAVQQVRPHLELAAAGTPTDRPDRLLAAAKLPDLLPKLAGRRAAGPSKPAAKRGADDAVVLIDGAPMLQATETSSVAAAADGVVLVLRAGITHSKAAARAAEQVRRVGGTLIGVLLVGVASPSEMGFGSGDGTYGARIFSLVGRKKRRDDWADDELVAAEDDGWEYEYEYDEDGDEWEYAEAAEYDDAADEYDEPYDEASS